jgi:hypothetical protein
MRSNLQTAYGGDRVWIYEGLITEAAQWRSFLVRSRDFGGHDWD